MLEYNYDKKFATSTSIAGLHWQRRARPPEERDPLVVDRYDVARDLTDHVRPT